MAPGAWYLNVLATYDGFRGKGCGSALLAHAETVVTMNTVQIFGTIDPAKISDYTPSALRNAGIR